MSFIFLNKEGEFIKKDKDELVPIPDFTGYYFGNKARNKKGQFTHKQYGIVYSPNKYRETEGIKDIGLNDWNQGRTQEIKERYVHLGGDN